MKRDKNDDFKYTIELAFLGDKDGRLTHEQKRRSAELIDEICDPSTNKFDPEKAKELINLIPDHVYTKPLFGEHGYWQILGISYAFAAASNTPVRDWDLGRYNVSLQNGYLDIVFRGQRGSSHQEGYAARLTFDPKTKEPIELKALQPSGFDYFLVAYKGNKLQPWKLTHKAS